MQGQKQKMVTIDWKPNRESKEPIYAQIVDGFREQITGGVSAAVSPPATGAADRRCLPSASFRRSLA